MSENVKNMTEGAPGKLILFFALPLMAANIFQQFYTMVDAMVVGQIVGVRALAAVGAADWIIWMVQGIVTGSAQGFSILVSQNYGAGNGKRLKKTVAASYTLMAVIAAAVLAVSQAGAYPLLRFLNTPADVMDMSVTYIRIIFCGIPVIAAYNTFASILRALGNGRSPLIAMIIAAAINVALDLIMVCSFHMGVAGVAWATLIAQGISAVMAFLIFIREMTGYQTGEEIRRFDKREFGFMVSIGMMLVQSVVNSFGAQMLAGYSAGMRIESICIVPMAAMGNVMSSFTAQNLGAKQQERVVKGYHTAYGIVFGFGILLCVILEIFYRPLILMFLGEEGTALALNTGMSYMRFIGFFFSFIGLKMITDGLLRGAGDMKMFTVANLVNLGIRVAVAVTMAPRFGIAFVWYAVPMGWLANYLISFARYKTGIWKTTGRG